MSSRFISSFKWLYPRAVIGSTIVGGIANNVYYCNYINNTKNGEKGCFNILDLTIDGMLGGFVFGVISPVSVPYVAISTLYDVVVDKDYEP